MTKAGDFALFNTSIDEELRQQLPEDNGRDDLAFFRVTKFNVIEQISEPFEVSVVVESDALDIDLEQLLGVNATLRLNVGEEPRYFQGTIGWAAQGNIISDKDNHKVAEYEIKFYPIFWFLKHNSDYRIFQET